jgi:hypothetical protein
VTKQRNPYPKRKFPQSGQSNSLQYPAIDNKDAAGLRLRLANDRVFTLETMSTDDFYSLVEILLNEKPKLRNTLLHDPDMDFDEVDSRWYVLLEIRRAGVKLPMVENE